ncbi:hypothetical protein [Streptomyces sp. NPDC000410]|uniref:hypothetical protein n=1 Tax=Streptomyces sp. NPDC000410 TaxID=3154254 RepID=UPI0033334B14
MRRATPSWAVRRGADPVDELAEQLDDFIAAAVHPDEIAALLESEGLTDEQIRLRYGREDSFALAEELYGRVERRYPEPVTQPAGLPGPTLLACLLRGLIFALPGLGYVLAAPPLSDVIPLLAGGLAAWAWNQALAHRAYAWLGLGDRAAARRALLVGAPLGVLFSTAASFAAGPALLFVAVQSLYLAAATVLLVLSHDRALLCALLPLVGGAVVVVFHPLPPWARAALLLTSVTAATAFAAGATARPCRTGVSTRKTRATRARRRSGADLPEVSAGIAPAPCDRARVPGEAARPDPSGRGAPRSAEGAARIAPDRRAGARAGRDAARSGPSVIASLPHGIFGLGAGGMVLHVALDTPAFAVALTLGMGPAEWLLHRLRVDSLAGLRGSTTPGAFRAAVAAHLARCLAGYLGALLSLVGAALLLWPAGGGEPAGVLLLGVALWAALLLQAFGTVLSAALVCCAAALAATLVPAAAPLVVPAVAAAVLFGQACALLGRITAHR